MASFRRSLSMVPQHGSSANEEEYAVASSLPKSSSLNSDHLPTGGLFLRSFSSLDYALYKLQILILGFFPKRSSRPLERIKSKGNSWRRALLHFLVCFFIGILIGITPFASPTFSMNLLAKHQPFSSEMLQQVNTIRFYQHDDPKNLTSAVERAEIIDNDKPKSEDSTDEREDGIPVGDHLTDKTLYEDINVTFNKLLIIVTPIYSKPFQAYYLNRLAQTFRLVPPPLLWIVVEMTSQSAETAEILRNSGVMHRHLICKEILTGTDDRGMLLRNAVLSHIETHQLDGIIYFADDDNIYTTDLFDQMRQIRKLSNKLICGSDLSQSLAGMIYKSTRRFGTWTVAKLVEKNMHTIMEGPICNGSQVMGWHLNERSNKFQKFHIGLSGFAFNSSVLWDPKRWHRPPLQPIRLLHSVKEALFQVSRFIEQIVKGENEMECLPLACSKAMVWRLDGEFLYSFPHENSTRSSLIPHWLNGVLDFAIIKNLID